jgi:hypothetical protein
MVSLKNRVNLLNPEHEATGRVLWVALDKVVQVLLKIPLGASSLGSYEINIHHGMKIFFATRLYQQPDKIFGPNKEPDKLVCKEPNIWKIYLRTSIVLMVLAKDIEYLDNVHYR